MINNDVNAGNFIYCTTHWGPYESRLFHNVGNGLRHDYTYLIDGKLKIEFRNSEDGEVVETIDSTQVNYKLLNYEDKADYQTVITEAEGCTAMFFNPLDSSKKIKVDILNAGAHTITATDKRITLVGVIRTINVNNLELLPMQHAIIFPGKTAQLVIPENGVCAAVSYL